MSIHSEQIKEPTLTKIRLDSVKIDPSNPNKMSVPQTLALEKSMYRFGYITPIIVDADTMMIADGEHRYLVYKELGYEEIPAYVIRFKDESERRMLRQVLNKLRGEHDKQKDADEFLNIMQSAADDLAELADFIVQPKPHLDYLVLKYHPELESVMTHDDSDNDNDIIGGNDGGSRGGEQTLTTTPPAESEPEQRISLKTINVKLDRIISLLERKQKNT
jgi:ParB-like nuclease domain